MPNHLTNETSPYLLQHRDNPVDWYPWGEEALEKARQENKPIFLSIGYSACHWCHVMAHESFEDEDTAKLLNDNFVSIKVDREERPDIDSIYMNAVQAISGSGGWPMSVFLMSDGRPFFGGTYFPKESRYGMPSFQSVLNQIISGYRDRYRDLDKDASNLTMAIDRTVRLDTTADGGLPAELLEAAFQDIAMRFDKQNGGFSSQPKFPPSMLLEFLLRLHNRFGWTHALEMVNTTLDKMAHGGMYDQLGGGFHRYSTDSQWLVPHFEKMLYDNALLVRAYLYGYQVTGNVVYRRVVDETIEYIRREMTGPNGGFYSSQDADSEGDEGKFFVWEKKELESALGSLNNRDAILDYWGVNTGPNFEGKNILWVPGDADEIASKYGISDVDLIDAVARARSIVFAQRNARVKPQTDTKIIASWNGLMIASLAQVARVLGRSEIRELAGNAAEFVLQEMIVKGRLKRTYKDNRARFDGYLEDYACVSNAFLEMYMTTFDMKWLNASIELARNMIDLFWDDERGFFDTAKDHEKLVTRPQELTDNATPSGTSSAVGVLLRLSILSGAESWKVIAGKVINNLAPAMQEYPTAFPNLICQASFLLSNPHEVALVGDLESPSMQALIDITFKPFRPSQVVAHRPGKIINDSDLILLLRDRVELGGGPTAYVCHNYTCQLPVTTPEELAAQLAVQPPS